MEFNEHLASEYEKGIRRTLPSYDTMLRLTQTFFKTQLNNHASILVIGCGSGNELIHLASGQPNWSFTGVDPSKAMLNIAQERVNDLPNNVQFLQGTLPDATLPNQLFDAASCLLVLHFIDSYDKKLATLKKIANHLKPNAPFVLSSKYGQMGSVETELQFQLWRAYWQQHTKLTSEQINEMEQSVRSLSFISENELITLLTEAGFSNISRFFATTLFGGWICFKEE